MEKNESWKAFKPDGGENLENSECYYERIDKLNSCPIPKQVVHQGIFPHYNEPNSVKNYSWIDLNNVVFELREFPTSFFYELNVIEDNKEMVENYSANKFAPWHRNYWRKNGTWEVPPIIIDVNTFKEEKPNESELNGEYQLVEGHNRLGTLTM